MSPEADFEHEWRLRVYYEDTDAGGAVYHASYLRYAERARTEFVRSLGIEHAALRTGAGLSFTVRRAEIDFLRPARLDDTLCVRSRLVAVGGARMAARQRILRDAEELVVLAVELALVDATGRPARLPAALRAALKSAMAPEPVAGLVSRATRTTTG